MVALGKSLAGAMRVFLARSLVGASGASSARGLVIVLSSGNRLVCRLFVFTKICMSSWRCLPSLGSNVVDGVGTRGLKGPVLC